MCCATKSGGCGSAWRNWKANAAGEILDGIHALRSQRGSTIWFSRGLIPPAAARTAVAELLGGGVSNVVIRVGMGDGGDDALVLKQSLPKLRVEEDWFADRERIYRERAGIDYVRGTYRWGRGGHGRTLDGSAGGG